LADQGYVHALREHRHDLKVKDVRETHSWNGADAARPEAGPRLAYSVREAAAVLGVSQSTMHRLVREGEVPSITIGSRVLVPVKAFAEWVDSRVEAGGRDHE